MSSNNYNNSNKVYKHEILSETVLSCTVCGMSRYDQLRNKEERLTKKEEKELEDYVNQKHWGLID
jgi:heterodisulfide reductase subunit B